MSKPILRNSSSVKTLPVGFWGLIKNNKQNKTNLQLKNATHCGSAILISRSSIIN
jgi:hypothetical protein